MGKLIGYRLKDVEGSFFDPKLKIFICKRQTVDLSEKKITPDTLTFQWLQEGGLVPVYEGESVPLPPEPKKGKRKK